MVAMGVSQVAHAQVTGKAEDGLNKASQCIGCHEIPGYRASFPSVYRVPMITGQSAKYIESALQAYNSMLESKVCPEQARMVLPQCMMTEFIETGSLAAYARLVNLRKTEDAQKEIRDVAHEVSTLLHSAFPHSWGVLIGETLAP